jgi:ketosteroid isomerase-like protein
MPAENVRLVREAYEAAARGDWVGVFQYASPDLEWHTDARLPNAGIYRGQEAVRRFHEDQSAPFEQTDIVLEQAFENGDQVVAFVRVSRRPRGSTAVMEHLVGHLWTIRDGKAVRCQAFAKREEALTAAGISPQPN